MRNIFILLKREGNTVQMALLQEGMHFLITIPQNVADKMSDLSSQEPEKWRNRGAELLIEAENLLKTAK